MAVTKPELWTLRVYDSTAEFQAAQDERRAIFERVALPGGNWKFPIYAMIPAEDFDDVNAAVEWFHGSSLTVVATVDDGRVRVEGPGYVGS